MDKSGLYICNWNLCLFSVCLCVPIIFSNPTAVWYKAAVVAVMKISIMYGSEEGFQGNLLVPQYILS